MIAIPRRRPIVRVSAILIAVTLFPLAVAPQTAAGSSQNRSVITPVGLLSSQCVHQVPSNSTVLPDGSVLMPNGTRAVFPNCLGSGVVPVMPSQQPSSSSFPTNGAVENAVAHHAYITAITGDWYVPKAPSSYTSQTIFLWDGITPQNGANVLQPVLSYGPAGVPTYGGNYWSFASWFATSSSGIYSTPLKVSVGDWLNGQAVWNPYTKQWEVLSQDVTTGHLSVLFVSQSINEYYGYVELEVAAVNGCSEYPASGNTAFSSLAFQSGATPNWSGYVFINDGCGEGYTIYGPTAVTLDY